jgi:predicted ATPase
LRSTPTTISGSRLDRLSPAAFILLAAGAVLERRLTFEHLCAISHVAEDRALPALDELVSGRLLSEEAQPGEASVYAFANDMLRDVVYTEAGDARRRLFHQRALAAFTAAGDSAAVLAHHALAAGLAEPAFAHSLAAGREALRVSAAGEAVEHLEKARQLAREAPAPDARLRELYEQLAQAYELDGRHAQALTVQAEWEQLAL